MESKYQVTKICYHFLYAKKDKHFHFLGEGKSEPPDTALNTHMSIAHLLMSY